jgi:hypothetical protein
VKVCRTRRLHGGWKSASRPSSVGKNDSRAKGCMDSTRVTPAQNHLNARLPCRPKFWRLLAGSQRRARPSQRSISSAWMRKRPFRLGPARSGAAAHPRPGRAPWLRVLPARHAFSVIRSCSNRVIQWAVGRDVFSFASILLYPLPSACAKINSALNTFPTKTFATLSNASVHHAPHPPAQLPSLRLRTRRLQNLTTYTFTRDVPLIPPNGFP